jgi:hypothetical protein
MKPSRRRSVTPRALRILIVESSKFVRIPRMKRAWVHEPALALSLFALLVACTGPRVEAPPPPSETGEVPGAVGFAVPRPGAAWPDAQSTCTLFGKVPENHGYTVYRSRELTDEVAEVGSSVPVAWRGLPRLGDPPVARLSVLHPMRLDGFAKLPRHWFVEARVDCENLVLSDVEPAVEPPQWRETSAYFELREFSIPLRDRPGGPALFVFRSPGTVVGEIERAGEFVRIYKSGTVMLDGFVHEAHLKPVSPPDDGCVKLVRDGFLDSTDRCYDRARVVREADVRLGASSAAEPIGKIEA